MENRIVSICDGIIYLLYVLLFLITPLLVCPWTYELFEFPKMVFVYFLAVLIGSCFVIRSIFDARQSLWAIFRPLLWIRPLIAYLICFVFSVSFSMHIYTSIFGYYTRFHGGFLSLLAYLTLFLVFILEFREDATRVTKFCAVLLLSGFFVSAYAILQHFGIDNDYWVQDSASRVFSFLGQPNWLAAWLLMVIPVSWAFYFAEERPGFKVVLFLLSVILFIAFWFTYSLSGLLGFIVMVTVFFIIFFLRSQWLRSNVAAAVLLIAYGVVICCYFGPYMSRLEGAWEQLAREWQVYAAELGSMGGGDTAQIRKIVWQGALDLWRSSPKVSLVGTGPETFAYAFLPYRPAALNDTSEWEFLYNKAHNEYLDILTEQGLVGLLTYLLFVGTFIWRSLASITAGWRGQHGSGVKILWYLNLALLCGWISLLVTNFFGFSVVPTALLFWLYPAFLCCLYSFEPDI